MAPRADQVGQGAGVATAAPALPTDPTERLTAALVYNAQMCAALTGQIIALRTELAPALAKVATLKIPRLLAGG